MTQNNLGLALQVQVILGGFPLGLEQVDRLARAQGLRDDPVARVSLGTLAILCLVANEQYAEASRDLASLVDLIESLPADFHLVWDWAPLRHHLEETNAVAVRARRESLLKLLSSVSRENKSAILAGLKEVQGEFTTLSKDPGKKRDK
jgi:hypothetical protein